MFLISRELTLTRSFVSLIKVKFSYIRGNIKLQLKLVDDSFWKIKYENTQILLNEKSVDKNVSLLDRSDQLNWGDKRPDNMEST